MEKAVLEFLKDHRVSVCSIAQEDGTVHAAALHFAHSEEPFALYVCTSKSSRKSRSLLSGKEMPASIVIGFDESEFATFQADGTVKIISDTQEFDLAWETYSTKYPDRAKWKGDSDTALIRFTPTWWRYTDMKTDPRTVISSEK